MKRLSALLLAFACIASLQADPLASRNRASIDDSGTYRGNFALNQAAGDAQQQSNVRVVAVGSAALVGSDQRQHLGGGAARQRHPRRQPGRRPRQPTDQRLPAESQQRPGKPG